MRTRQLFLDVQGRRREGEYRRLVGEVEELERRCACPSPASAPRPPFPAPPKPPACPSPSAPYNLVADASRAGAAWATAHRVDVFSITPLDAESPEGTPAKPAGGGGAKTPGADAPAGATAAEAAEAAAAAVTTPASTLFTPQASSTASSADASSGAAGGTSDASSSPSSSLSRTAERWRQQDFLAQIDKDLVRGGGGDSVAWGPGPAAVGGLPSWGRKHEASVAAMPDPPNPACLCPLQHRTFPGTPHMDEAGRATLRRILAAYARRNPAVGYCQARPLAMRMSGPC